jgi:hypothetical protein
MSGLGYAIVTGSCFMCKRLMSFNPLTVPSTSATGTREPVCRACVENVINPIRVARGEEPVKIAADAYEPIPAERLL